MDAQHATRDTVTTHRSRLPLGGAAGFALALGVLGCGAPPAPIEVRAIARVEQAGVIASITVHWPTLTGKQSVSTGALVATPIDAFCGTAPCTGAQLDAFPLFFVGQRLNLSARIEPSPTPDTVIVRLLKDVDGIATTVVVNDSRPDAVVCTNASVCVGGLLDLASVGPGNHEIQVQTVTSGFSVLRSLPLTVLDLDGVGALVTTWIGAAAAADPTGLGLELTVPLTDLDYAGQLFELNPVATFSLLDSVNDDVIAATNGTYFTTDLDAAIDLLSRARFFTGLALMRTTYAARSGAAAWDLLSGQSISGPTFPFNSGRTFNVDQASLLYQLFLAISAADTVATGLESDDIAFADALVPGAPVPYPEFTADAAIDGTYALGDEDFVTVTNTSGASVTVTLDAVGACALFSGSDPVLVVYDAAGAFLARDDDTGVGLCAQLSLSLAAGASVYVGIVDYYDNSAGSYQLVVDFGADGTSVTPIAEVEPNDDGAVTASGTANGNDFNLIPGSDPSGPIAARNANILGGVGIGTVATLLGTQADVALGLRNAAMFDGDDIMATFRNRPALTVALANAPVKPRAIYNNDGQVSDTEPAYGRFILASVRDAVTDTLALPGTSSLPFAAQSALYSAQLSLDQVASAMEVFPEGFNVSPIATGVVGANEKLMREVFLAAQDAMTAFQTLQSSIIDTTAWQAGLALGLSSVSRFSAFTGSRPMSGFRATTDAAASFECRFGKALLDLQLGEYDQANGVYQRSRCLLVDVYNEHYAKGTSTDGARIPDDRCIPPASISCPVGAGTFANGCARVDSTPSVLMSLENDPGWDPTLMSNCGQGTIFDPIPVTLPVAAQTLALLPRDVEPSPTCYQFTHTGGPLVMQTTGDCELGIEDTEIYLYNVLTGALVYRNDTGVAPSLCESYTDGALAAGTYLGCVGNRSSSAAVDDSFLSIDNGSTPPCAAGTYDHDGNSATACLACSIGSYCAGGLAAPVTCSAPAVDDDLDPASACAGARIAGAFTWGDTDDDTPPGLSILTQQAEYDAAGNLYVLSSWTGTADIGALTGLTGGAVLRFDPTGTLTRVINLQPGGGGASVSRVGPFAVSPAGDVYLSAIGAVLDLVSNIDAVVYDFGVLSPADPTLVSATNVMSGSTSGGLIVAIDGATGFSNWNAVLGGVLLPSNLAVDGAGDLVFTAPVTDAWPPLTMGPDTVTLHGEDTVFCKLSAVDGSVLGGFSINGDANTRTTARAFTVLGNGDYALVGEYAANSTLGAPSGAITATFLGASFTSADGNGEGFVARLTAAGVPVDVKEAVSPAGAMFGVRPAADGGYYFGGAFFSTVTIGAATLSILDANVLGTLVGHVGPTNLLAWVSGTTASGNPPVTTDGTLPHLAVGTTGGHEVVRLAQAMVAGSTFAGQVMPAADVGLTDTSLREITLDADTGAVLRLQSFNANGPTTTLMSRAFAVSPVTGHAVIVGTFSPTLTLDSQSLATAGDVDHFMMRLAY